MSDYYSALLQAIDALKEGGPLARRSLYEHAQAALLAELVSRNPRPSAGDIDRENRLLADAIRKIESELAPAISGDRCLRSRDVLLKLLAAKKPTIPLPKEYSRGSDHFVKQLIDLL